MAFIVKADYLKLLYFYSCFGWIKINWFNLFVENKKSIL